MLSVGETEKTHQSRHDDTTNSTKFREIQIYSTKQHRDENQAGAGGGKNIHPKPGAQTGWKASRRKRSRRKSEMLCLWE